MQELSKMLDAESLIRQAGLKRTQSRLAVLQILLQQREVLTADDIYETLRHQGAQLNFSTVYRILELFTEKNLPKKLSCQRPERQDSFLIPLATPTILSACPATKSLILTIVPCTGLNRTWPKRLILKSWAITWNFTGIAKNAGKSKR